MWYLCLSPRNHCIGIPYKTTLADLENSANTEADLSNLLWQLDGGSAASERKSDGDQGTLVVVREDRAMLV